MAPVRIIPNVFRVMTAEPPKTTADINRARIDLCWKPERSTLSRIVAAPDG